MRKLAAALPWLVTSACVAEPVFEPSAAGGGGAGPASVTASQGGGPGAGGGSVGGGTTSTGQPEPCGNWALEPGEECEDGNTLAGDGCSPDCALEATCGNGIVEPGEACDTLECSPLCEPLASSPCFGAPAFQLGSNPVTGGPSVQAFSPCSGDPVREVGVLDSGPIPMRIVQRWSGTYEELRVFSGCSAVEVNGCAQVYISDLLPPHTLLWFALTMPNQGQNRTLRLAQARWASYLDAPGTMFDQGGTFTWQWQAANNGAYVVTAVGPGDALLVSPPVDLSGVTVAAVHFHHDLSLGGGAVGRVEYSVDGSNWVEAAALTMSAVDEDVDVILAGAEGMPSVEVRFSLTSVMNAMWSVQSIAVGPPWPP